MARRLMEIIIYQRACRVGETLSLDGLAETEIGDWTMPQFRTAREYAVCQGWLVAQDDVLRLTVADCGRPEPSGSHNHRLSNFDVGPDGVIEFDKSCQWESELGDRFQEVGEADVRCAAQGRFCWLCLTSEPWPCSRPDR